MFATAWEWPVEPGRFRSVVQVHSLLSYSTVAYSSHSACYLLALCWAECRPEGGHLTSDEHGNLLLCFICKAAQRLTAIKLPSGAEPQNVGIAFELPALSAAAVVASRAAMRTCADALRPTPKDLLVLHPDGRLLLFVGNRQVCELNALAATETEDSVYARVLRRACEEPVQQPDLSEFSGVRPSAPGDQDP